MKRFGQPEPEQKTIAVEELFQRLEGILTMDQLQSIWNAAKGNSSTVTQELEALLGPHKAVLLKRGFVSSYLAYMLPHFLGPRLEAQRRLGPRAMWN